MKRGEIYIPEDIQTHKSKINKWQKKKKKQKSKTVHKTQHSLKLKIA